VDGDRLFPRFRAVGMRSARWGRRWRPSRRRDFAVASDDRYEGERALSMRIRPSSTVPADTTSSPSPSVAATIPSGRLGEDAGAFAASGIGDGPGDVGGHVGGETGIGADEVVQGGRDSSVQRRASGELQPAVGRLLQESVSEAVLAGALRVRLDDAAGPRRRPVSRARLVHRVRPRRRADADRGRGPLRWRRSAVHGSDRAVLRAVRVARLARWSALRYDRRRPAAAAR